MNVKSNVIARNERDEAIHTDFCIDGRVAQVHLSNGLQAYVGEVHPAVLNAFDLNYPVVAGEISLAKIF